MLNSAWIRTVATVAVLALSASRASAQGVITPLAAPVPLWDDFTTSAGNNNGVFLSPDGSVLVSISTDCAIRAMNPVSGALVWNVATTGTSTFECNSGIVFSGSYLAYMVTDSPNTSSDTSRVIALSVADGSEIFQSSALLGSAAGTPVTSGDGRYIYVTHNSASKTVGHFSILDTSAAATPLSPMFEDTNTTNPYSPLAVYHNPAEGYYDGGEGNTKDIVIWNFDTVGGATAAGDGQMFVFQEPIVYNNDGVGLAVVPIGPTRTFQSSTAAVLTNSGRSLYGGFTRASVIAWVGSSTTVANKFSRGATATLSLDRGSPAFIGPFSSPTVSFDEANPTIYGAGPAGEFYRANATLGVAANDIIPFEESNGPIYSRAVVSPDNAVVYYATFNGFLYQRNGADISQLGWVFSLPAQVESDIALSADGTILYVLTTSGNVLAYTVATATGFTTAPVAVAATPAPSPVPDTSTSPTAIGDEELTLLDLVVSTPELSTLVIAVETANLTDALDDPAAELTVFAPSDDAFSALDQDYLTLLLTDEFNLHLANLLSYHIADGIVLSSNLTDGGNLTMLNEETIIVTIANGVVTLGNEEGTPFASVTIPDTMASNGVAHIIDGVLLPSFVFRNVTDSLPTDTYSTLLDLLDAANLTETVNGLEGFTLFAPTNDAFAALSADTLAFLTDPANVQDLTNALLYHVVPIVVPSNMISEGDVLDTLLDGATVTSSVTDSEVMINESNVISPDILFANGIAHGIDAVLLAEPADAVPSVAPNTGTGTVSTTPTLAPVASSPVASPVAAATEAPAPTASSASSMPAMLGWTVSSAAVMTYLLA